MAVVKGAAAIGALNEQSGGGSDAEITPFKSGTTLKVMVKGTEDLAQYYNYGIFKVVNSFVPKNPAERNAKGFITANPTPWDQAAQYYFDKANETSDKTEQEKLKAEGRKYRGKPKFLMGFYDLTSGKDIVVDLTKAQAMSVYQTILKYEKKLSKLAFELSKQGESTSTTVSLTPIIDMDEDLTDQERANFEKAQGKPFNDELFDGVLYEMDEAEQIEALKKAGFDVSLIGLEGAQASGSQPNDTADVDDEDDPTAQF